MHTIQYFETIQYNIRDTIQYNIRETIQAYTIQYCLYTIQKRY
jgi:hypothetical protein